MIKFRVHGGVVELYKYKVDCTNMETDTTRTVAGIGIIHPEVMYFVDAGEADAVASATGCSSVELDTSDYDWINGIILTGDDSPVEAVLKIYEMGEVAYKAQLALIQKSKNEQLRADLDYVMLMGGL